MTPAELFEALAAAESDGDVIAALWTAVDGDGAPPSPEDLAAWWPECPDAARAEAGTRLRALYEPEGGGDWPPDTMDTPAPRFEADPWGGGILPTIPRKVTETHGGKPYSFLARAAYPVRVLARHWLALQKTDPDGCPAFPLAPIVRAWIDRPRIIHPERRRSGRLPARLAQVADGHGRSGDVLPRLAGAVAGGAVQYSLLPSLGGPVDEYAGEWLASALPVELYLTRGRGAPLDIRLGLEAILSVRPEDRRGHPAALGPWPWKRWLERVYPGRKASSNATRVWPGLQRALGCLRTDSRWWLPVANGQGGWEAVHVVAPIRVPLTGHPSERVTFAVTLDNAARRGGVTDRRLIREAGAKSTAALGLTSGLPLIWDRPGDLRAKEAGRWEQNADPRAYPLIALRGVVSLMYPGGPPKRKRWPSLEGEARALLDWLADRGYVTWTREPGGRRIMPGPSWPGWRPEQRPLIGPPK